jgi:hypothetical protein
LFFGNRNEFRKAWALKITTENEIPGDPTALFRVSLNGKVIREHLTAVQAQLIIAELMQHFEKRRAWRERHARREDS